MSYHAHQRSTHLGQSARRSHSPLNSRSCILPFPTARCLLFRFYFPFLLYRVCIDCRVQLLWLELFVLFLLLLFLSLGLFLNEKFRFLFKALVC
jgi:hypothetical protein